MTTGDGTPWHPRIQMPQMLGTSFGWKTCSQPPPVEMSPSFFDIDINSVEKTTLCWAKPIHHISCWQYISHCPISCPFKMEDSSNNHQNNWYHINIGHTYQWIPIYLLRVLSGLPPTYQIQQGWNGCQHTGQIWSNQLQPCYRVATVELRNPKLWRFIWGWVKTSKPISTRFVS